MKELIAILNAPKKHSIRYDLVFKDNKEKIVGSIYWPKDAGEIPKEIKVTVE